MAYTPQTWTDGVSSASAARFSHMEAGIEDADDRLTVVEALISSGPGVPATSLPESPSDGDKAILVDSLTAPTYAWTFQYEAGISDANKWLFLGGSTARAEIDTSQSTASTSYTDLATAGPSITVPVAGVYEIQFGFQANKSASDVGVLAAVKLGAAATADAEAVILVANFASPNGFSASRSMTRTLAASDVLKLQYKATSANTANIFHRWLHVLPVRVA